MRGKTDFFVLERSAGWWLVAMLIMIVGIIGVMLPRTASADSIVVTTTADSGPGSLRDAISRASSGDTVTFAVTGTIVLTSGALDINQSLTIQGPGPGSLTISGHNASRVFEIGTSPHATVSISGLTITNGTSSNDPSDGDGGAILNHLSTLTVTTSTFINNSAQNSGGAIANDGGILNVTASTFVNNRASTGGGAIAVATSRTSTVTDSTFTGNTAPSGSAVANQASLDDDDQASSGTLNIINATISGNGANALANASTGTILNLSNTIAANNDTTNCVGPIADGGGNLRWPSNDTSCPATVVGDPKLGQLVNNGGPTQTMALLRGSAAIDAGNNAVVGLPTTDQRGLPRIQDGAGNGTATVDIGAFEIQRYVVSNTNDTGPGSLRQAIIDNNNSGDGSIAFNIAGTGPFTIQPASPLPTLSEMVSIDGTTQPGFAGTPLIVLNGSNLSQGNGLHLAAGQSMVRGLVIGGFNGDGIIVDSANATEDLILGNDIGTDSTGTQPLGNSSDGILITGGASNNTIGGTTAGAANTVAFNGKNGVTVASGTGNVIRGNSIFSNTRLGIDLGGDGVTLNHLKNVGTTGGANNLQNFPVVVSAEPTGSATNVVVNLNSTPNTAFEIDFYASPTCSTAGYGQGQTYLGSESVTTDANGNAVGDTSNPISLGPLAMNVAIAATATDPSNDTSEFSQCALVSPNNDAWPRALPLTLTSNGSALNQATTSQYIFNQGQARWYKFSVQPGSLVTVTLTGASPGTCLPTNYDLVLYKDIGAAYNTLASSQDLVRLNTEFAPDSFSPDSFSPDSFSPDSFSPDSFSPDSFSPDSFSPDSFSPDPSAYASAQLRSIVAVSAFNGTACEGIRANTWDNSGNFYVRVRGRDGAYSLAAPFQINVTLQNGTCATIQPITTPHTLTASAGPNGGYKTVIVTDLQRLQKTTGASTADIDALWSDLNTFAARPEVNGVIVNVGPYSDSSGLNLPGDAKVIAANSQADSHYSCPVAKNEVATAIKELVDTYRPQNQLKYVVLIGGDAVIPFFRQPDQSLLADESGYVPPVKDNTASQASLQLGYVLTQDAYGSSTTLSLKTNTFPVPGLAVGRLVETPSEIKGMIDAYAQTNGVIKVNTSPLVTGYDFLASDANAIAKQFQSGLSGTNITVTQLIEAQGLPPTDPSAWHASDLSNALLGGRHDVVFLAGHFSQGSALAADYSTRLLTTDVLSSTLDMSNELIFSAGCHSGYNTVDGDAIPGVTISPDWAQTFAEKHATLIAGTGYQYANTDYIAYSAQLYLDFAQQLVSNGSVPIGPALVAAKQGYLASTPVLTGIHQKTVLEATLYGLPMMSVSFPASSSLATSPSSIVSATTVATNNPGMTLGLTSADVSITPSLITQTETLTNTDEGGTVTATYLAGSNGDVTNPTEIVLPLETRNVSVAGTVLRGVGFRGGTYSDQGGITPLTSAAGTELSQTHAPFHSPVFFPIQQWAVNYFDTLANAVSGATLLDVIPAQFISDAPSTANLSPHTGTLRQYSNLQLRLYYSNNMTSYPMNQGTGTNTPALSAPPSISGVVSSVAGTGTSNQTVTFNVNVTGDPSAGIQAVWITYTGVPGSPDYGSWQSLDLTQSANDSTLWQGTLALPTNASASDIRYIVQAVNGVGLVALATNQGAYYVPGVSPVYGSVPTTLTLDSANPGTGEYNGQVTVGATLTTTSNGSTTPLAGQIVSLGIGTQRWSVLTDANGHATAKISLFGQPGQSTLAASYAGTGTYAASTASSPFSINKRPSHISLAPISVQYTDPVTEVAALTDDVGRPLAEKTIFFVLSGNGYTSTWTVGTDYQGRAPLPVTTDSLPRGTYNLTAYFDGTIPVGGQTVTLIDPEYLSSTASAAFTSSPEETLVTYTGPTTAAYGTSVPLSATVTQADADGTIGDLSRAQAQFQLTSSAGTIVATLTAPISASGTVSTTVSGLAVDVYTVEVTVIGDYFTSPNPATGPATANLTILAPSSNGLVTGGGWFDSPVGACKMASCTTATGRANFAFNVHSRNGSVTGETEFHFRAGNLDFHSSAYKSLGINGSRVQFQGTGTVSGQTGTDTFTVIAVVNDDDGEATPDTLEIQITDPSGVVIYDSQNVPISRGDIVIHENSG